MLDSKPACRQAGPVLSGVPVRLRPRVHKTSYAKRGEVFLFLSKKAAISGCPSHEKKTKIKTPYLKITFFAIPTIMKRNLNPIEPRNWL